MLHHSWRINRMIKMPSTQSARPCHVCSLSLAQTLTVPLTVTLWIIHHIKPQTQFSSHFSMHSKLGHHIFAHSATHQLDQAPVYTLHLYFLFSTFFVYGFWVLYFRYTTYFWSHVTLPNLSVFGPSEFPLMHWPMLNQCHTWECLTLCLSSKNELGELNNWVWSDIPMPASTLWSKISLMVQAELLRINAAIRDSRRFIP